MIVAEVRITAATSGLATTGFLHTVLFDSVANACDTYHKIADLLRKRGDRKNDLPKLVDIQGTDSSLSLPLDTIQSVGWLDFAKSNEQQAGIREAFPHLYPNQNDRV